MHEALLIAKREYRERVRSKAFLFMTIAFPALMSLAFGGSFLAAKLGSGAKHVAIASNDAGFAQSIFTEVSKGKKSDDTIEVVAPGHRRRPEQADLRGERQEPRRVSMDRDPPDGETPDATYISRSSADLFMAGRLQDAVNRALTRQQLVKRGASPAEIEGLLKRVDVKTSR